MQRQWVAAIVWAVLVCAIAAPLQAQAQRSGRWSWAGRIGAGQTVTVDAVRADVRVLPSRSGEVALSAVITGVDDRPETVTLRVDTTAGGVTFRTFYAPAFLVHPARRIECLPADSLHGDFWYSDVRATLTLRVPPGIAVAVRVMWGDIKRAALPNPLRLETQNGTIR